MTLFFVESYYVKSAKKAEYQDWLRSDEFKALWDRIEKECGMKWLDTFTKTNGIGQHDFEDWFELPNWEAMDKFSLSPGLKEYLQRAREFLDESKDEQVRIVRSLKDAKFWSA